MSTTRRSAPSRLADIRYNLTARITEAEREGWLGEVEGLQVSLAGATTKLAQIDQVTCDHHDTRPGHAQHQSMIICRFRECATPQSACFAWPAGPTSPPPCDTPPENPTDSSIWF